MYVINKTGPSIDPDATSPSMFLASHLKFMQYTMTLLKNRMNSVYHPYRGVNSLTFF